MSEFGEQIVYKQLLDRHARIEIPMIQRDYAQGRPAEEEVREEFLSALEFALTRSPDDPSLPLNLDFIYGSVEGKGNTRFAPLDGQQRLTTLFLLHWYLAWKDESLDTFRELFRLDGRSRFSYRVRPSSNEFFDALVNFQPGQQPAGTTNVSGLIADQPWYYRNWRLDPTIQSTLHMLDALHQRFSRSDGLYSRLTSDDHPAITFQLLDLKDFGLSDDLYIKMNARGKPLTPFESFKARYEQQLAAQFEGQTRRIGDQSFSIAEFVSRRLDTAWADLFWRHRRPGSNLYDRIVMKAFQVAALVSRNPTTPTFQRDVGELLNYGVEAQSYSVFQSKGWLNEDFAKVLISLLETWSGVEHSGEPSLPENGYYRETALFEQVANYPNNWTYTEVILFSGYALFVQKHEGAIQPDKFRDWMRIVHNLAVNTEIARTDRLQTAARGLRELLEFSDGILEYISQLKPDDYVSGFSDQQLKEEILKAGLILGAPGWRPLIERAELHGYFRGQIEFLCEFSGATEKWKSSGGCAWDDKTHREVQERFNDYLLKAEQMFTSSGLRNLGEYRWQRALLCFGDYLLPSGGRNSSFLVNGASEPASWKRLLRGGNPWFSERRLLLKRLLDRLTVSEPIGDQLDGIIASATELSPWIEAFVHTPAAIEYCGRQLIRWESAREIYLLSKSQMNGDHAELFTYCLYHNEVEKLVNEGRLKGLSAPIYQSVWGKEARASIRFEFSLDGQERRVLVQFSYGKFLIGVDCEGFTDAQMQPFLAGAFAQNDKWLVKTGSKVEVVTALIDVADIIFTGLEPNKQ